MKVIGCAQHFKKSCTSDGTWPPIWKYLKWSFEAIGNGYHPVKDPDGKPLEKGSPFFECKGQPLHPQGLKGTLWSIIGDQEFFSNALGLPHWNAHHMAEPASDHPLFQLDHISCKNVKGGPSAHPFLQGALWSLDWWDSSLLLLERRPRKNVQEEALGKAVCVV